MRADVIMSFFHFRGNSERRVHVFLRHLEKMSHPFFEPKMGVLTPPGHFQQKRSKKGQKFFLKRGRKIPFPVPAEENFFLFFFPLYENTAEAVLRLFEAVLRL